MSETDQPQRTQNVLTVEEAIAGAMRQIPKRPWGQFIADEDARQEMWLWAHAHRAEVNQYLESYAERPGWSFSRLRGRFLSAAQRYAEAERAEWTGSSVEDQQYYNSKQVIAALTAALDGSVVTGAGVVSEVKAKGDPAEGGGLLASAIDAKRAWAGANLSVKEREAILLTQVLDMTHEQAAYLMSSPVASIRTWVRRGGWKLVNFLGGESPWTSTDDRLRERP